MDKLTLTFVAKQWMKAVRDKNIYCDHGFLDLRRMIECYVLLLGKELNVSQWADCFAKGKVKLAILVKKPAFCTH